MSQQSFSNSQNSYWGDDNGLLQLENSASFRPILRPLTNSITLWGYQGYPDPLPYPNSSLAGATTSTSIIIDEYGGNMSQVDSINFISQPSGTTGLHKENNVLYNGLVNLEAVSSGGIMSGNVNTSITNGLLKWTNTSGLLAENTTITDSGSIINLNNILIVDGEQNKILVSNIVPNNNNRYVNVNDMLLNQGIVWPDSFSADPNFSVDGRKTLYINSTNGELFFNTKNLSSTVNRLTPFNQVNSISKWDANGLLTSSNIVDDGVSININNLIKTDNSQLIVQIDNIYPITNTNQGFVNINDLNIRNGICFPAIYASDPNFAWSGDRTLYQNSADNNLYYGTKNLSTTVSGPISSVDGTFAIFSGTNGQVLKTSSNVFNLPAPAQSRLVYINSAGIVSAKPTGSSEISYVSSGTAFTVQITSQNIAVEMAIPATLLTTNNMFIQSSNGRLKYTGTVATYFNVTYSISLKMTLGTSYSTDLLDIRVNGITSFTSKIMLNTNNDNWLVISATKIISLNPNDYISMFITDTSTVPVSVDIFSFILRSSF